MHSTRILTPKVKIVLLILFISQVTFAQEQLGLKLSNYTGINSIQLNPAWTATSKFNWDINLVAAGTFVQTNYGYIENASTLDLFRNNVDFIARPDINAENQPDANTLIGDYNRSDGRKMVYLNTFVTGPSVMVKVRQHSFGITTNFRTMGSIRRIPGSLGYYQLNAQPLDEPFNVDPFAGAAMAWSEIGLNYSTKLMDTYNGELFVGGTLKFLQGYEGVYFQNHETATLTLQPNDTAVFNNVDFSYAFATNAVYNETTGETDYNFQRNGGGLGLDLGLVYTTGETENGNYRLKLGASLLDIGKINFKTNAEAHRLTFSTALDSTFLIDYSDYEDINSSDELVELLSNQVLGDSAVSFRGDRFGIWLPAALSLQADFAVNDFFFVNAAVVRRLTPNGQAIQRTNLWSVTPRVEWRWFEASIPVVLVDDRFFRFGAAFRLGPLTLGSDNIPGLVTGQSELNGTDFYVALKINPFFSINRKQKEKKGTSRFGKKGNVKCYNF